MQQAHRDYWHRFRQSQGLAATDDDRFLVEQFGNTPALTDELVRLVVAGKKTATCALLLEYTKEGSPLPKVGEQKILLNSTQAPLCIVEVTEVTIRPFSEIDGSFAYDEGEGDRSYAAWHKGHTHYFSRVMQAWGEQFSPDLPVVCERFKVIYQE
jgi:uncharacterized protein YhfF